RTQTRLGFAADDLSCNELRSRPFPKGSGEPDSAHDFPVRDGRLARSVSPLEQLREYFEVCFRAEKYGVPYFLAESEAKQSDPRKEAAGARARSGRGFKWKVPRERARRGRNPFKPQTVLLRRR